MQAGKLKREDEYCIFGRKFKPSVHGEGE